MSAEEIETDLDVSTDAFSDISDDGNVPVTRYQPENHHVSGTRYAFH